MKKKQKKVSQLQRVVKKNVKKAKVVGINLEEKALKEFAKIKKQMDATAKKVEAYVKKNPEKAAAIAAGVGVALGAVAGVLAGRASKK